MSAASRRNAGARRFAGAAWVAAGLAFALGGVGASAAASDGDATMEPVYRALAEATGTLLAQADAPVSGAVTIAPAEEPAPPIPDTPVFYDKPLDLGDSPVSGKSIEELIAGKPLFPPIEGLDEAIWKDKPCGTCHEWTRERLCTQAKTYIGAEHMIGRLEHPYGIQFKQALEKWGEGGCQ